MKQQTVWSQFCQIFKDAEFLLIGFAKQKGCTIACFVKNGKRVKFLPVFQKTRKLYFQWKEFIILIIILYLFQLLYSHSFAFKVELCSF